MNIRDIPDLKSNKFPERITVPVTSDTFIKLKQLKDMKRKDVAALIRMLIDNFVEENKALFD
jgi:hypothetical protein